MKVGKGKSPYDETPPKFEEHKYWLIVYNNNKQ